jgi:hypothetical protein
MTPEVYDALRAALDHLPPSEPEPAPPTRRLLIRTYAGETIFACLRIDVADSHALRFFGFDASTKMSTEVSWVEFAFFDMESGALGILADGGKVFGPVLSIEPQVIGRPWKRPRRFTPLRLAAANGALVRPRRAPRTRRRR